MAVNPTNIPNNITAETNAASTDERRSLVNRQLPSMVLSDGAESSMTGPPLPFPHYLNSEGKARYRFTVEGSAVITGGTGTLALNCARALLEHGCSGLALLDRQPPSDPTIRAALSSLTTDFPSSTVLVLQADVTDEASVRRALEEAKASLDDITICCCFAGVVDCQHAVDLDVDRWRQTIDVNLTGSYVTARAVAREMMAAQTGGSIVFIASISGHIVNFPQPQASYNVSKAGVLHLTKCLAAEWARYGIRVNSISPGYMDTILNEGPGLAAAREQWNARNPMGRMGTPEELAGPLIMLCSYAGSFINGADIVVDGGACVF
ncbi:NAD(P)-binding protein [Eremomyces bilateralis CBS 781.70]|uniref:D-arabinitol 2-dehydrogenase [ribulose-forming] n=1 Tax=Eremomyces bilateralis CBS 781.70 TaxID=1392243 RepID=A0A6G1G5Q2_9PEZI|nr:NAD(P)-binding protein [Eremomyces bilateralis CBS 781.70]KAF1813425.1 NAD(P)-binding protein [Eremomyces bilateralis CBS 781.70]